MKHLIILFFLMLFIPATIKAQTKEETLQWLNEYCKENTEILLSFKIKCSFTYTENQIIINFHTNYEDGDISNGRIEVNYLDIFINSGEFSYKDNLIKDTPTGIKIECKPNSASFTFDLKESKTSQIGFSFNQNKVFGNNNSDFAMQWAKAICHLAQLSGAKEKPKTTKDMFK